MNRLNKMNILKGTTGIAAMLLLSACGIPERLSEIGHPPEMSGIQNPTSTPGYRPVVMPMPTQEAQNTAPNSLWQASRQTFFKDQRAAKVGDIVTVNISINDTANLQNSTDRSRTGSEESGIPSLLGMETQLTKVFPEALDPSSLVSTNSTSTSNGTGAIKRSEAINLKLAATVTQLLSNGNFVIQGRQQVLVNNEMRDLSLQGVIRPQDILNDNTISYEKIAEARIAYGGKGNITNLQSPRYGQQFIDAISPF
jgi:flagellar L-ring protein precursor FlgH